MATVTAHHRVVLHPIAKTTFDGARFFVACLSLGRDAEHTRGEEHATQHHDHCDPRRDDAERERGKNIQSFKLKVIFVDSSNFGYTTSHFSQQVFRELAN